MAVLEFNTSHGASYPLPAFMLAPEADCPPHLQTLPSTYPGGLEQVLVPRAINFSCPFHTCDLTNFWLTKQSHLQLLAENSSG